MKRLVLLLLLLFSGCRSGQETSTPELPDPGSSVVIHTVTPGVTPHGTSPEAPTAAISPATPQPYEQYTITALRERSYGEGTIEVLETMEENEGFTRYLIRYPSDDLSISGFANVPKGEGPFPVIIAIHGFVDPAIYQQLDYTTDLLDRITQQGYIVFHPDLRNYPPSDEGDNLFRVGMSIDVLNLMALIRAKSGPSTLFATAAPEAIGLLGHSMGGSIALRVLTVSPQVKATVLYATMSGDELENAQVLFKAFPDPAFQAELEIAPEIVERISPVNYYRNITSPIQLHHGRLDETVPLASAEKTCAALTEAGLQVECIYYPDEDHTFRSRVADQFNESVLEFYAAHLSP
jgi:dienelactone hydrolase